MKLDENLFVKHNYQKIHSICGVWVFKIIKITASRKIVLFIISPSNFWIN